MKPGWNALFSDFTAFQHGFISAKSVVSEKIETLKLPPIRRYTKIVISRKVLTLGWWNEMRYLAILRHLSVQSLPRIETLKLPYTSLYGGCNISKSNWWNPAEMRYLAILRIWTRFHQCKVCSFRENWNFKIALYITIRRYTKIVISRKVLTLGVIWWNPSVQSL